MINKPGHQLKANMKGMKEIIIYFIELALEWPRCAMVITMVLVFLQSLVLGGLK